MQKPKSIIYYNQTGQSGNIFHILYNVQKALKKERRIIDWNECRDRVFNCGSYKEALNIISEYVILKETEDEI